jgi:hypothetical protein
VARTVSGWAAIASGEQQEWVTADAGEPADKTAQVHAARAVLNAEDDPRDHFKGDRLHARAQRERLTHRPPGDLVAGDAAAIRARCAPGGRSHTQCGVAALPAVDANKGDSGVFDCAAYNGTAPIEVSPGPPHDLPAVPAGQPAAQPCNL